MNKKMNSKKRRVRRLFELQFIISVAFTIIAVAGIIFVGATLYIPFYRSTLNIVSKDQHQVIEQVNLNLDVYLRSMMKISDSVYFRVIKNTNFYQDDINNEVSLLYDVYRDRLVSIALFNDSGAVVSATPLSNQKTDVNVNNQDWFINAKNKIENLHFSTPHVQNIFEDADYRYRWVVSLSRSVDLTYGGIIRHGVLLVDMNFSGIEQICRRVTLGDTGYVYIVDQNGEIIYHPNQQLIYSNLKTENISQAILYEDGGHFETFDGRKRLVTVKTAGYTGWKIVGVSYTDEVSLYKEIAFFTVLVISLAISIMIVVNQYASKRIANPIKEEKLKSELDSLQSQINPHFLYNALDSIVWMIEKGNNKQAVVMVTAISRLFRIGTSRGNNIITVGAELEHAKNYLTIQNIRFKNKFTYEVMADDEVLEMSTIKLIIQPIIENAIYHGMEFMDGDGLIRIEAGFCEAELLIKISDNGMGMPKEEADLLLKAPAQGKSGSGIGLYNVQKRIQLYFGEKYGLTIESEPDVGTSISIKLPKIKYTSGEENS